LQALGGCNASLVAATLTKATETAERAAAETMIVRHSPGVRRLTLAADKGYDAAAFVADMRALNVTPHIAQNISGRRSAIDARTTRHPGYAVSQQKRKRIEEPFGWGKTEAAQLALSSFKHVCAIFAPCPGLSGVSPQSSSMTVPAGYWGSPHVAFRETPPSAIVHALVTA
jgi:hypothetical protein